MKILLPALIFVLIATACKSNIAETQPSQLNELIGSNWILESMEGQAPIAGTMLSLQVSPENFSGSAGCNRYSARYSAEADNGFSLGELALNAEGCIEPDGIMQQEARYIDLLSSSLKFQLVEQELVLLDQHGNPVLVYRQRPKYDVSPESLTGKTWQLVSATDLDDALSGEFSIRFDGGTFNGTTACRNYEGKYQAEGDEIFITYLGMTSEYDCTEAEGAAEGQFTTFLENMEQYNVNADQLELYIRRGEKLIFERADE